MTITNPLDKISDIVLNCMGEDVAPCISACPMGCQGKEYIRLIQEDNGSQAMFVIRDSLFLPGSLGRVCAHPCETSCKYSEMKNPLSIASIKRYITDNYDDEAKWDMSKKSETGFSIAVMGSGPAGAQAALSLIKEGHKVTVYDQLEGPGGMMRIGIPNYRLPNAIIEYEYSYLIKLGVEFVYNTTIGIDISMQELQKQYDAVVVAVGKQIGILDKGVVKNDTEGVYHAVEFLKEISQTENFSSIGKHVLVIGGGDVAMDCARSALRIKGVDSVEIVALENSVGSLTASRHEVYGAIDEGVEFHIGWGIKEIENDQFNRISKVTLKKCTNLFNEKAQFSPQFDETQLLEKNVDTVVFAIGQKVDTAFAQQILSVPKKYYINSSDELVDLKTNPNGTFIHNDLTGQSPSVSNIFIAGDCGGTTTIVVQAMESGKRAAESVNRYLQGKDLALGRTNIPLTPVEIPLDWGTKQIEVRVKITERDPKERVKDFKEIDTGYTKEEVLEESTRCIQCQCKLCMDECIMMHDFGSSPRQILKDLVEKGWENSDPTLAFSCSTCNQCTIVCPKNLDLKSAYMDLRKAYTHKNKGKSPMKGHRAIDTHQFLGFSRVFTTANKAPAKKDTKYLFFPGCSLSSYSPDAIKNVMFYLNEKLDGQVGSLQMCCGKPTKAMGQVDLLKERLDLVKQKVKETGASEILVACQNCFLNFREYIDMPVTSLWTLIPQLGIPESQKGVGKNSDVIFNIHDSCPTRSYSEIHRGIRKIVDELGYKYEELERSGTNTECCGFGGMTLPANPKVAEAVMVKRASRSTTGHMISYCAACRSAIETGGVDSVHLLDLVFNDCYMASDTVQRNSGSIEQWKNRYNSKKELIKSAKQ